MIAINSRRPLTVLVFSILVLLLATGCQAPAAPGPTSPTDTPTTEPSPTHTYTPEPSPTPSPTPTPTPDTRVVDVDPRDMLLIRVELPPEGKWFLEELTPHHNSEVISVRGLDAGNEYVRRSGRIDSWYAVYARGTSRASVPDYIQTQVILFQDPSGPIYVMDEGRGPCKAPPAYTTLWPDMDVIGQDIGFGDASLVCLLKEMQANGKYYLEYQISVAHRNVLASIYAWGQEGRFELTWLVDLARLQFDKVAELPLSESVTFSP